MKNKKKSTLKSVCCKAELKYSSPAPDFFGEKGLTIGTCYCICSKCGEPCNIMVDERRTWAINPKTRVVPNKKKKNDKLFTDKELKKFRNEEDF